MAKKELTNAEENAETWKKIHKKEQEIADLKESLHPAELPKQASLADCNKLARSAKVTPVKVDPKRI
tara:strand:- start:118 stop:318 length:201 start_codon:yes stop_codon:yes gene_type:complete